MAVYYNEIDPFCAEWLRQLMKAGEIPDGTVDERDIRDVHPSDVREFTQCHWFAGIGGWALALRLAGVSDEWPCWTGSCPCQPFSAAGAGGGGADERHLWPAWFWLIERCRPAVVFGEQVEAAIRFGWLDLVHDDLEGIGYTVAPVGLPAASVGAPHIRQRLWFVAESDGGRCRSWRVQGHHEADEGRQAGRSTLGLFQPNSMADTDARRQRIHGHETGDSEPSRKSDVDERESVDGLGNTEESRLEARERTRIGESQFARPQQTGPWDDIIWLPCRDGKRRPTQPGLQPLVNGFPGRVGVLRGAGNAIVPEVASAFIEEYLACTTGE